MNDFLVFLMALGAILGLFILLSVSSNKATTPEPTKVCRDGKLYEVTHEGNITIYDRKDFMTCEEK